MYDEMPLVVEINADEAQLLRLIRGLDGDTTPVEAIRVWQVLKIAKSHTIGAEALKPTEERLPRSVLKPIINAGLGTLSTVADVAQVWGTWGKEITTFFLGAL